MFISMKGRILRELRSHSTVLSGEQLSAMLGVSRVSVWKHIHKLRELGYEIRISPNGYELINTPDVIYPWEFPNRESKIIYYPEVPSTMDIAKQMARKQCPEFTVVIADRQTKGRGRLNREWLSEAGGLYFTMVLRPQIPLLFSSRINFLASLTLAHMLRDMFQIEAMVKWPNDILVNGCKVSGMLSELEAEAERILFINIGMGINVNNDPSRDEPAASSLKLITGMEISRKELLSRFLDKFEFQMENADFDTIISEWKNVAITLNQHVRIVTNTEESQGIAVDVDENGALVLKLTDGTYKKIVYGDCFHQA